MDDFVLFGASRAELSRHRRAVRDWLMTERGLRLNPRKGHIRPAGLPQIYLGYRVTPQGFDLAGKAVRRYRRRLPDLIAGDRERFGRSWAAWCGAVTF